MNKSTNTDISSRRNYGIDLLRLVAAFYVVSIHTLTSDLLWYFSCYLFVCLLSPYLNKILRHSSDAELKQLFWLICGILITVEYIGDSFEFGSGFTSVWLLLLYLLGGILKKTGMGSRIPACALFLAIIVIDVFYFLLNLKLPFVTVSIFRIAFAVNGSLVNPFFVAPAILHVLLFSRFTVPSFWQKLIKFAASASFSVYIVNTHPLLWDLAVNNRFSVWAGSSPVGLFVRVMVFSTAFVTAVVIADFFRRELFRLLGVTRWPRKIAGLFRKGQFV